MDEVLLQVSTRPFTFSAVEMLFHTSIASFFPFIIFCWKSKLSFRIFSHTFISDWVNLVIIVLSSGDKFGGFSICEVTLLSITHANLVEIVSSAIGSYKTWLYSGVLMRNLLLNFLYTWWLIKSRISADWKFCVLKISVVLRRVKSRWWRRASLKINVSSWEPRKLCFLFEWPTWLISSICFNNFFTSELWKIIISGASSIQICLHSFDDFFIGCSIIHSFLTKLSVSISIKWGAIITVHVSWIEHLRSISEPLALIHILGIGRHYNRGKMSILWWKNTYCRWSLISGETCSFA